MSHKFIESILGSRVKIEETEHFNKKEITKLYTEFKRISNNQSLLGGDEFRLALGVLGLVSDSVLCQRLFDVFNKSKSGYIDFPEYAAGLGVLMKGTVDEKLDFAFSLVDLDNSGSLSLEELVLTVESIMRIYAGVMGGGPVQLAGFNINRIKRAFKKLDTDGDGKISKEEYKIGLRQHPDLISLLRGSQKLETPEQVENKRLRKVIKVYKRISNSLHLGMKQVAVLAEQVHDQNVSLENGSAAQTKLDGDESDGDTYSQLKRSLSEIQDTLACMAFEGFPDELQPSMKALIKRAQGVRFSHHVKQMSSTSLDGDYGASSDENYTSGFDLTDTEKEESFLSDEKLEFSSSFDTQGYVTAQEETDAQSNSVESTSTLSVPKVQVIASTTAKAETGAMAETKEVEQQDQVREGSDVSKADDHSVSSPSTLSKKEKKQKEREKKKQRKEKKLEKMMSSKQQSGTVFFGHKNWNLVVNVMKGIQMAVNRVAAEPFRPISVFDFSVKEKYTLISQRTKVSRKKWRKTNDLDTKSCRFIDYAPFVFKRLRESFGIKNDEYIESIGPKNMISNLMLGSLSSLSEQGTEGKSGSFFYITPDGKYLIKTVHREEHKIFRHVLPEYFHHMAAAASPNGSYGSDVAGKDKQTLLTWILGCHIIRLSRHSKIKAQKIYLVVMNNVFHTDLKLDYKFDLKGSRAGRKHSDAVRKENKVTLKDMDFKELNMKIKVGPVKKAQLMACLKRDCGFLEKMGLIDYSLLLGIHQLDPQNHSTEEKKLIDTARHSKKLELLLGSDNSKLYFVGLLDFLTPYGKRKFAEQMLKTVQYWDPQGISVQPPHKYSKRFISFMDQIIE